MEGGRHGEDEGRCVIVYPNSTNGEVPFSFLSLICNFHFFVLEVPTEMRIGEKAGCTRT